MNMNIVVFLKEINGKIRNENLEIFGCSLFQYGGDSSRMRTDRAVTRSSSERVTTMPIVGRQTHVKTLPSLAVGNYGEGI